MAEDNPIDEINRQVRSDEYLQNVTIDDVIHLYSNGFTDCGIPCGGMHSNHNKPSFLKSFTSIDSNPDLCNECSFDFISEWSDEDE